MDFDASDLDGPSMSWKTLKSHYEYDDVEEEEEEEGAVYPCSRDFDVAEFVEYHIRDAHLSRSDYDFETCPICAASIQNDMVKHLIMNHGNSLDMELLLKLIKAETCSDSSIYGEHFHGSSWTTTSEAEAAFDKLLSFICEVPPMDEVDTLQTNPSASANSSVEECPAEKQADGADHPSHRLGEKAADKEAQLRCNFVQDLTFSAFFKIDL